MRAAMAAAEVGDDVYGEDPTVNALEEQVAGLFGHEAAVFVPSGTMGNQICLRLVVPPAEELVCDADAHVVTYEHGGAAQHGGIQSRTVTGGPMDVDEVAAFVRPAGWGTVATSAVSVEQTHNRGGGAVQPLEVLQGLRALATSHGMAPHGGGARGGAGPARGGARGGRAAADPARHGAALRRRTDLERRGRLRHPAGRLRRG